eukprot:3613907-Amphidinium_carterae.1
MSCHSCALQAFHLSLFPNQVKCQKRTHEFLLATSPEVEVENMYCTFYVKLDISCKGSTHVNIA